jgi:hypothetical protein
MHSVVVMIDFLANAQFYNESSVSKESKAAHQTFKVSYTYKWVIVISRRLWDKDDVVNHLFLSIQSLSRRPSRCRNTRRDNALHRNFRTTVSRYGEVVVDWSR